MPVPTNRLLFLPLLLFLISTSVFQPKWLVLGSPVPERSFKRPDPLRHFKDYNGGFDLRNKHYMASAAFTGVHGYAIAGVWLLCGLAFGIFMIVKSLTAGSASLPFKGSLEQYYLLLFLLVLVLTSLAIVASSFVLATSHKSLRRTERLKESVLGIAENGRETIGRVIKNAKQMQSVLLPYEPKISANLNSTIDNLRNNSRMIRRFADTNEHTFDEAIHTLYIAHVVVVTINLAMVIAALVLLLLHWRPGFIIIIFCCWILTTLCWVLTGLDFFLHTFVEDVCFAFEDFEQNPQNSSLGLMLPCINEPYSGKSIAEIGHTIHNFIAALNSNMSTIYRLLGLNDESEQLMGFIKICDPFSEAPNYSYSPNRCPQNAIWISDLPKILARLTCHKEDKPEECKKDGKFLPEASYNMARAYSITIQDLLNIYPDLQSLSKCTFVKNKISDILSRQCRPIRISARLLWSFVLSLSIIMVVLVLAWVAQGFICWEKSLSLCSRTPRP